MANIKLTNSRVQAIRPAGAVQRVWDSIVLGFHVRITPAGAKAYCVTFQRPDGGKVSVTIGACGSWDVEAARDKARELRTMHDAGKDARAYLQAERNAQTVQDLAGLWAKEYREALKPSSRELYDSLLKVTILPAIGQRLVKDLSYEDVKKLHRDKSRVHAVTANRAITVLSRLLSIAEKEGWRSGTNPCRLFRKPSEKSRSRVLEADTGEFAKLEAGIQTLLKSKKLDPQAGDLFRFLALSGLRKGEALGLRFTDVDLERGVMRFEDHKTSERTGTKVLPLNSHLRAIIQRRATLRLGPYVFPGWTENGPIVGVTRMWARLMDEAKLIDLTPHDLRRTFMSVTVELGYPPAIGDTLLGHSLGKIRDTYTRLDPSGIIATASQETADWIAAAMAGKKVRPGVKIATEEKIQDGTA